MSIPSVSNGTLHPFIYKTMQDAATILIILPLAAVYSFTQKLFMEGIEKSGITG
jgi:ABC-type maltose transport system permease subunit